MAQITKNLKNATFVYDEEKKVFTIMDEDGFNGYVELNKIYAFAFMRFVVRMAQRNWLRGKSDNKKEKNKESIEEVEQEALDPDQLTFL
tara:strand:- start:5172 stop:5438 length:267 start_codon:yes stop_codon:yes gene_type:complete